MAKIARAIQWQVDHFTEIPVLVVACLRLGARDGRLPFVRMPHVAESAYWGSIYPSVQNLLLAARAMGLGASLITLPLWSRHFGAPTSSDCRGALTPCCIVPLGWPRGRYGPTTRKPVEQVAAPGRLREPRLARHLRATRPMRSGGQTSLIDGATTQFIRGQGCITSHRCKRPGISPEVLCGVG